ncbi:peptide deformylase [Thermoflavimicrobium daqui]|uniref:Peptide deformylase n=1 Tax=Thermoflavimicrobium daqui TaxID=2137476 RepID=A0A364K4G0_9BACL|nr:peptide deformylase [Thermoflavimicrobium daqui]RAL24264.1 peptide deformylase [Thermoflavimicrobium daqui]
MAEKRIIPFGDPMLRKVSKPVLKITPKVLKLLDDMKETLYAAPGRAGLSAVQVGILRRVVVMDCGDGLIELINPEIIEKSGEQIGPEACLSFPNFWGTVKRANYVKVKYLNRNGEETIIEGEGFLARCLQHEIDHLNGVLFIDHIQNNELFHDQTNQPANLLEALRLTQLS